ncbi:MAG: TonB family protein [Treponema sp.]|jgi:protein TonB|nr:TonB family protein [Treponema sp.]
MKKIRIIAFLAALLVHISLMAVWRPEFHAEPEKQKEKPQVIKLIDIQEFQPQAVIPPMPPPPKQVPVARKTAEQIVETEEPPPETMEQSASTADSIVPDHVDIDRGASDVDYLPQNKISEVPKIDADFIRNNLVYPTIAQRAGVEGRVILELFIDNKGEIRHIGILKEDPPDRGFGESAINAFRGITAIPAKSNGQAVAVRYRYPVRFKISK